MVRPNFPTVAATLSLSAIIGLTACTSSSREPAPSPSPDVASASPTPEHVSEFARPIKLTVEDLITLSGQERSDFGDVLIEVSAPATDGRTMHLAAYVMCKNGNNEQDGHPNHQTDLRIIDEHPGSNENPGPAYSFTVRDSSICEDFVVTADEGATIANQFARKI